MSARPLATLVVSLLVFTSAAGADWLVTHDGQRIETDGSWEERQGLLVFHLADGTLASLKKSQVDLEESLRITRVEQEREDEAEETVEAPREKATFVLTDADVRHISEPVPAEEASPVPEAEGAEPVGEAVEVIGWREADLPSGDGMVVTGTARNVSQNTVARLSLEVVVLDHDGAVQATAPATLSADILAPGQSCTLSSELVGIFDIAAVRFGFDFVPVRSDSTPTAAQSTQRPEEE